MTYDDTHLVKQAKAFLRLNDEERIAQIRRPRWIGYSRAKQILVKLEELLIHPKQHRMPNLLIVGDTNNGKTMIINRFYNLHPPDDNREGDEIIFPVLIIQAPPVPDEGRFYDEILLKLSAPFKENDRPSKKQVQVRTILDRIQLRMLVIDEIHHILAGSLLLQHNFRNALKHLGNELKIPIIGVGTQEAFNALQTDLQLANRFEPILLPRWDVGNGTKPAQEPYLQLLASFEGLLPLKRPSNLTETKVALKLLSMSEGLIGELSTILTKAAVMAILTSKEMISVKTLDEIDYIPPTERKWKIS